MHRIYGAENGVEERYSGASVPVKSLNRRSPRGFTGLDLGRGRAGSPFPWEGS